MSSMDAHSLARVHALHKQYFGDVSGAQPQSAITPIIPPIDDDDDRHRQQQTSPIVFSNPFASQSTNMPVTIQQRPSMFRYPDSNGLDYYPVVHNIDNPPRRTPAAGLFRQIDWKNAERPGEQESRDYGFTLKRAPSASSSASGSSKVKAQKENGIFRKTSQKCGKLQRAVKEFRTRHASGGSEMMEGVESSAPVQDAAMSPSVATASQRQGLSRFPTIARAATLSKTPRHDTPQPVNGNTPVAPSSGMPVRFTQQRFPVSHLSHSAAGGEAARRAAAASNGARYHPLSQITHSSQPAYQMRRDSYRKSICSIPNASDSGADLASSFDIDMLDIDKPIEIKADPVAHLPTEIVTLVFSHLDASSLKACRNVNKSWAALAVDDLIWKGQYLQQFEKQVYVEPAPIQIGGAGTGRPNKPMQQWELMYDARKRLNQNWAKGDEGGKAVYLSGHTDSVYCVQFDEEKIITGSRDRTIRVWDINTYKCIKVIGGPTVKPVPGPKRVRTVDQSKLLGVRDSVNGTPEGDSIYQIPSDFHSASILCLQYDEEILVTGSSDNDLLVWDVKTFEPIRRLKHHGGGVLDVAFDSKHIVSCSKDCTIVVWDRKTLLPIRTLSGHRGPVNAVQLRGHLLVSASGDGVARLWDLNKMECIREFPQKERGLAAVEFSDDAKYVLAGGNDHTTYKFDVATGAEVKTFTGHTQLVRSLFLDTQNRRVVSGSYDLDLRVYDYDSGELLGRFNEWTTSWMLAAKSDYRRIVSTSQDGRILVIDFGRERDGREIPGIELLQSKAYPKPCFD